MGKQNLIINNTVGGELSPSMNGRIDLPVFQKGLARCENFICMAQGGATFRTGTQFVKFTNGGQKPWLIPFTFSDSQSYILEFTLGAVTFYRESAIAGASPGAVLEGNVTVTAVTAAAPGVFTTSTLHGYTVGQEVYLSGFTGNHSILNGRYFYVNTVPTTSTFTLRDVYGNVLNTTGLGALAANATVNRVYKIAHGLSEAQMDEMKDAQTNDLMYLTHNNFPVVTLTRSGDTSWAFANPNLGGAGPLSLNNAVNNYPRAVAFSQDSRVIYGGSNANPNTTWGSKTPAQDSGSTRYNNFGAAAIPLVTDGFVFTIGNSVDVIQWIGVTPKFLVLGGASKVVRMFGANEGESPNPTAVNAKVVSTWGADRAKPVAAGSSFFYIERGSQRIRNLVYDFQVDAYDTPDMNLVSDHISYDMKQIVFQNGTPDILWGRRQDGRLVGLTHKERENIAGWHRHYLGGQHIDSNGVTQNYGKLLNMAVSSRATGGQRLWVAVERRIGNQTSRSIELLTDFVRRPFELDFYSGSGRANRIADAARLENAHYEAQKDAVHLDMSSKYDGTQSTTLTLSATTGTNITITAGSSVFTSAMVTAQREAWVKYDSNGNGGGRARLKTFVSGTQVTADVISDFASTSAASNGWMITTNQLTNLNHLEGATVKVVEDGAPASDKTVVNGAITLDNQSSKAIVGFGYKGLLVTLNLDYGGQTGSAYSKPRQLRKAYVEYMNTIGSYWGTDIYDMERVVFPPGKTDRGTPVFNGKLEKALQDGTTEYKKQFAIAQNQPLPCTVLAIDLHGTTQDE